MSNDLITQLFQQFGPSVISQLSGEMGTDNQQTKSAIGTALPILLNALTNNTKTPDGANDLLNALNKDHDGSLLDNVMGFLNNSASGNGAGIINHILGPQQENVASQIGEKSGIGTNNAMQLIQTLAPILMAFLGKQNQQSGGNGVLDLLNMFTNTQAAQNTQSNDFFTSLLDSNKDGNIIDDIAKIGMNFFNKK